MTRNLIKSLVVIEILIAAFQINAVNADAKAKNRVKFTADGAYTSVGDYTIVTLKKNKAIVDTKFKTTDETVAKVKKINNRKARLTGVGFGWCELIAIVKLQTENGIEIKRVKLDIIGTVDEY